MRKIKFTNLYQLIPKKKVLIKKIEKLIKDAKFIGGKEVLNFEKNFSKFVSSRYCISVANGTDALEIAVKSLNLPENSEVVIPTNTWISTAEAVVNNNLKPIFCDVNLDDYTLCTNDLKKKITKKTSAIMVVHMYGNPANISEIKKIIQKKSIKIIEDCAQAHGTKINNKHVGTFGDVSAFSFFPGKNLGAFGDAGAIITNSKKIYNFCRRYKNHGALLKHDHSFYGRNSRLDTINALVLNHKLKNLNLKIKKRNQLAKIYFDKLMHVKDIDLYKLNKKNNSSFHQFVIRYKQRDKLQNFLKKQNVDTMVHYPRMIHEMKFTENNYKFQNSKNLGKHILSLPISEEHTFKELNFIIKKIKLFTDRKK